MQLSPDVQIALSLLQVTGLLLPIVFIALQPFYETVIKTDERGRRNRSLNSENVKRVEANKEGLSEHLVFDDSPRAIYAGAAVIGCLLLSTIFAVLQILRSLTTNWLLAMSALFLLFGLLSLGVLYYLIRTEFKSVVDAV
ncbi:hypothetical protein NDI85_21475 [Halomicroarcula sp. S1AR25-4]|uniref:hypothetical protein n=1 Tax=Haloarcula sp. S1AR25-4 TaxID=2950538 RepID=UPI00287481AF|nr:hypothetical protein [Halomicroarcula sp. S1AR25-4]MDS0280360.1 hypothetical protein [Halomicroarcula sp. S1AR25-4]